MFHHSISSLGTAGVSPRIKQRIQAIHGLRSEPWHSTTSQTNSLRYKGARAFLCASIFLS
jgi:hypothetical protein